MAEKKPLVLDSLGEIEELPVGSDVQDPSPDRSGYLSLSGSISKGEIVSQTTTASKVQLADGSDESKYAIGVAAEAFDTVTIGQVQTEGVADVFTGLTTGEHYYLDATTPGAITTTVPTASGSLVQVIGRALSPTAMLLEISDPIKRG